MLLAGALLVAGWTTAGPGPEDGSLAQAGPPDPQPNVVVIMTDDQDLRSLSVMGGVRNRLAEQGTTFENAFATFPLCCPSRATFLTGQYAHNHGVTDNKLPFGGYRAFTEAETALPVALDEAGYRTGLVGKYLNKYFLDDPIPPGWDVWRAARNAGTGAYNYALRHNDRIVSHGHRPEDYRTDVYADLAANFIRGADALRRPFFLTVTPGVPHAEGHDPPTPGPNYQGRFDEERLPRPPSFNEADVSDKPAYAQVPPRTDIGQMTSLYRARLASLLPVDDLVKRVVKALQRTGELSDTYIVFTSDNGYLLGEHRLKTKTWLYEESARVPLIIRGPGVPANETRTQLTGNVDLAPTILDAADAAPLRPPDGRSLLPLAADPAVDWRDEILLENRDAAAIRTEDHMYAEHHAGQPNEEHELYDLEADPFQLESLHDVAEHQPVEAQLRERLARIVDCEGPEACP